MSKCLFTRMNEQRLKTVIIFSVKIKRSSVYYCMYIFRLFLCYGKLRCTSIVIEKSIYLWMASWDDSEVD